MYKREKYIYIDLADGPQAILTHTRVCGPWRIVVRRGPSTLRAQTPPKRVDLSPIYIWICTLVHTYSSHTRSPRAIIRVNCIIFGPYIYIICRRERKKRKKKWGNFRLYPRRKRARARGHNGPQVNRSNCTCPPRKSPPTTNVCVSLRVFRTFSTRKK